MDFMKKLNPGKLVPVQSIPQEKATKFIDLLMNLLGILGVYKLSDGLSWGKYFPYGELVHTLYRRLTLCLFATYLTMIFLCAFVKSSKDILEFFSLIMEVLCMTLVYVEMVLLNSKRTDLLKLLNRINKFNIKITDSVFINIRKMEKFTWAFFGGPVFFVLLIKYLGVFVALNDQEHDHVQEIYGFKNPQKRLPMCIWIPFVDTSEEPCYAYVYLIETYYALPTFGLVLTTALLFPFIVFHLVGQYIVLSKLVKSLGEPSPWTHSRSYESRRKNIRQVIQVRECIVLHQMLLEFREMFGTVTTHIIRIRVILLFVSSALSAYPITILSNFDGPSQVYLMAKFVLMLSFLYCNCLMSEILEWANCRARLSIYQSRWYQLCPEAKRMVAMFLQRTQRPHYIQTLGGMVVLGNVNFFKTLKLIYSFIRFVHLKKK